MLKKLVFSDGKLSTVQMKFNPQNDRIYAASKENIPPEVRTAYRNQKPASVMIWAAVTEGCSKSRLVIVDRGVKINSKVYQRFLKTSLLPWATDKFGKEVWTYQEDGAPCHSSKGTQK